MISSEIQAKFDLIMENIEMPSAEKERWQEVLGKLHPAQQQKMLDVLAMFKLREVAQGDKNNKIAELTAKLKLETENLKNISGRRTS